MKRGKILQSAADHEKFCDKEISFVTRVTTYSNVKHVYWEVGDVLIVFKDGTGLLVGGMDGSGYCWTEAFELKADEVSEILALNAEKEYI